MLKKINHLEYVFAVLFIFTFHFVSVSCRSIPPSLPENKDDRAEILSGSRETEDRNSVSSAAVDSGRGTVLTIPSAEQLRQGSIDPAVLRLLERGSPDSLRAVVARISSSTVLSEGERIALAVAGELMNILYPLETIDWTIPEVSDSIPYIGAIRSARMGVYDYNTGNTDFLTLVLPSLVMAFPGSGGDYQVDARISLERAQAMNRDSVLPSLFLGLLDEREGRTQQAAAHFRQAWELDASSYPAGAGLARQLLALGKTDEAYAVASALTKRYPRQQSFHELAALAAFSAGDWRSADPHIAEILRRDPGNIRYLLMRARILVEGREYLRANSLLDAFATRNTTDKQYLILRSRVALEWNRNPALAVPFIEEALRLYSADTEVLLSAADLSFRTGRPIGEQTGRQLVEKVLVSDPVNRRALVLLTEALIASAEWALAVRRAEQLVSLQGGDEANLLLARAYLGARRFAESISILRQLYQRERPSDELTSLFLESLVSSGNASAARSLIASRLAEASSGLKSVFHYFENRLTTDDDLKAIALRSSLLADPRNVRALFAMYELFFRKKDYRRAQYYLKQNIALDPTNRSLIRLQAELDVLLARQN